MKKKLYLVDVSSMFFRAFFAIRELRNSEGLPTNALYGFLSMTIKLLKDFEPSHMVYCRDRKEPSFRKELDPRYKANRSDMPEDLALQMPYIEKLTSVLGIPQIDMKGYEADDVIGSLSHWGTANDFEVVIVSGDKDFAQLINKDVVMFDPMKSKTMDVSAVKERWGVTPEQFIDYLAIVGDSSDNIPGVRGIGPKGAEKLLNDFNDLDGVYENLDKTKGATLKKLTESKDEAYLSKKLVSIVTDLDLLKEKDEALLTEINQADLEELFTELEFEKFLKNFKKSNNSEEGDSAEETDVEVVELKKAKDLSKHFEEGESVFYIDSDRGELLVSSHGKYHSLPYEPEDLLAIGKAIKDLDLNFLGFGLKSFFRKLGVSDLKVTDDIKLMCYSLVSDKWDFKKAYAHFCEEDLSDLLTAKALHKAQLELYDQVSSDLKGEPLKLYKEMDLPLMKILLDMEFQGILLDQEMLFSHSEELGGRISKITEDVHAMVEKPFNLASPKQLAKVLFEDLGLAPIKKTKTGFSTNTDILEKLKSEHPICEKIIEFRELSKLKSTYVDAIPKLVSAKTKRVHTTYKQALTTTGRLSSVNPNLQNIPIRTAEGRRIRKAFIAKPGHVLISADYSQIELRILAHITKDKGLVEAFLNGQDVHARTAAEVFDVALSDVTTEQRRMAKAVNFGIAYGQGAYGLAETLGISRKEGKEIIESYFTKFPGVKDYIEGTIEQAKKDFFTTTLLGRKRELDELKSSNKMLQKFGERAAINAPIQGTASDLIRLAMIEVVKEVKSPLLLQVHDELIFEVKEEDVEAETLRIKKAMEEVYKLDVPLTVGIGIGHNWDDAH
ncbi:MAG: DNA polymerase I [Bdellovibrionales bacterium]